MPESHKAERRRAQKQNKLAGIGDADGRIPSRVKEPPKMIPCSVCQQEMKCTKTNTELKAHAEGKHAKTIEVCIPGAVEIAAELAETAKAPVARGGKSGTGGATKAESKKKASANMDDLLSAGLGAGTKKKGKK
jgi:hypothetical protein